MPATLTSPAADGAATRQADYAGRFQSVRARTLELAAPLSPEDQCVQPMPDASPTKWHLAHSTWFFEAVVLAPNVPGYRAFDPRFFQLFNSYYESLGPRHPRPQRGLLTRPSLEEVRAYRRAVDEAVLEFAGTAEAHRPEIVALLELGLQHEQQHQELLLTDILFTLSCNPLLPAYQAGQAPALRVAAAASRAKWLSHPGGVVRVGHVAGDFAFDNERPAHDVLLQPFGIADRLVTCGEYAAFIGDGGYERAGWWLSDGWAAVQAGGWRHPLYWIAPGDPRAPADHWQVFGLEGVRPLDPASPVMNLSFYEASAFAEWSGARLPTEFEWEAASSLDGIDQLAGHAWQWTRSAYEPYPGFRPWQGAVGEYNGKFMVGQQVLRGGSLATPPGHTRPTYRNFFPPPARWQFSGLRLARDAA